MVKPTMVLLHGVGLDHTVWEPLIALLEDGFSVVTPDLPGHGEGPPLAPESTLGDLAEGIIDHVPLGSHLVGFSLGALVAQHIAINHSDRVSTLTSVSTVCGRTVGERASVLSRLSKAESDFEASSAASIERWYSGTDVSELWVKRTQNMLNANDIDSFVSAYRIFATADAELAPQLGRIPVPALAVTGADDPGSTPEMAHRLAAALPYGRAVIIEGARHMLPVQRPEALAEAIITFIGRHVHV